MTLCLDQPRSADARRLLAEDSEVVVWWSTAVECASAIARLHREGVLTAREDSAARALFSVLRESWYEIQPGDAVRAQALRVLRLHPLRAADALQLAAALEWAGSPPKGTFVSFDERLLSAARREGFAVP